MLARLAALEAAEQPAARQPAQQREQQTREAAEQQEQQGPSVPIAELPDAAAKLFEAQFPPGFLSPDWRSWTWRALEKSPCGKRRDQFRAAKRKAIEAALAIMAGSAAPQQVPPQQQQQQQQWLRQPSLSGEPSGPRDSPVGDVDSQAGAEGVPVQMGPRGSSQHEAETRQQQQQHAGGTGAGMAPGAAAPAAAPTGVTAMQAMVQERLKKNLQQATNSYSMPQAHLQQHLQQQPQQQQPQAQQQQQYQDGRPVGPAVGDVAERIHNEPLRPWMLHYILGANRAIFELLPAGTERNHLLTLVQSLPSDINHTNLDHLRQLVLNILQSKRGTSGPDVHAWGQLGLLINQATDEGPPAQLLQQQQQQVSAAMPPAAAPGPMLPPHLRHAAGARPNLPPHLQQQPPQQQPPQQQPPQQQADDESGSDEADDDTLLDLLGVQASSAAAAAADVQHPTGWAAVTGHQQDEDEDASAADYPALGSLPISAEDAEMERALAASRADQAVTAGRATVPGVSAAGLANQAGEYNCFLNVVVQCLWSCKAFTREVRGIATQKSEYDKHPVVEALLNLFGSMEAAEAGWQPGHER
jgi:hypothetical protein